MNKKQNKGYYAVQGHSRSPWTVSIESLYASSYYWLLLTDILSRTVSGYRSLLFTFWTLCVFEPPMGGLGVTYDVYLRLIGKRVVDLMYLNWGATSENRLKIGDLYKRVGQYPPNFHVKGTSPTNHFYTDRQANECLTTLSLIVFTHRDFVDFLQTKCDFTLKTAVLRFWAQFGGLGSNVRWSY